MTWLRRLVLLAIAFLFAGTGLMLVPPEKVEAAACGGNQGPVIAFGRQNWCGYFSNQLKTYGDSVRLGGVPGNVAYDEMLIGFIENQLNNGNAHQQTAAQFLILTMIGRGPGGPKSVSAAQLDDWKKRVASYADISENGLTSFGQNGRIDWYVSEKKPCAYYPHINRTRAVNTYYQKSVWEENNGIANYNDVAPYLDSDCSQKHDFILFRDTNGNVIYRIRRACLNPIGQIDGLKQPQPDQYDLAPSITATVDGQAVSGGAEVGQTIQFAYSIRNNGSDPSPAGTNCVIYTNVHVGFFAARSNPPPGGGPGPGTGCPKSFGPNSNTQLGGVESVPANIGNRTICRSLIVSPATATEPSRSVEACVQVVNKPYSRVYGGDVVAGRGFETAPGVCATDNEAAVIGWNKRGAPNNYGGAGTQFAAYAMHRIYDFSSSLGNPPSNPMTAPRPQGLSFANVGSDTPNGNFGGMFGSVPCIRNYLAEAPASNTPWPGNISNLGTGVYKIGGGQISGPADINPGERITLYVDGDLYLRTNVRYVGSWDSGSVPSFRLIVRGNLYIDRGVVQLDGLYVAQPGGVNDGIIFTCAGPAPVAPTVPSTTSIASQCSTKLTVNGSFVARQIQFLRTAGTLSQSDGAEPSTDPSIAEVFNYSPALWIQQPSGQGGAAGYDAITSLPPIL